MVPQAEAGHCTDFELNHVACVYISDGSPIRLVPFLVGKGHCCLAVGFELETLHLRSTEACCDFCEGLASIGLCISAVSCTCN